MTGDTKAQKGNHNTTNRSLTTRQKLRLIFISKLVTNFRWERRGYTERQKKVTYIRHFFGCSNRKHVPGQPDFVPTSWELGVEHPGQLVDFDAVPVGGKLGYVQFGFYFDPFVFLVPYARWDVVVEALMDSVLLVHAVKHEVQVVLLGICWRSGLVLIVVHAAQAARGSGFWGPWRGRRGRREEFLIGVKGRVVSIVNWG